MKPVIITSGSTLQENYENVSFQIVSCFGITHSNQTILYKTLVFSDLKFLFVPRQMLGSMWRRCSQSQPKLVT